MKLKLSPNKICFKLDEVVAGNLVVSAKPSASNHGTVFQVGKEVKEYKKGDKIVAAMWGVEHAKIDDKDYYFIDADHRALICGYE